MGPGMESKGHGQRERWDTAGAGSLPAGSKPSLPPAQPIDGKAQAVAALCPSDGGAHPAVDMRLK